MKHTSRILAAFAMAIASSAAHAQTSAPTDLPRCEQPIASVMVGKLQCKASNCHDAGAGSGASGIAALLQMVNSANGAATNVSGIADGIKDVLVTALSETGCFDVQDRDAMEEIAKELELAGKKVQTQQADFLISGAVTQIDVSTENKSFGGGLIPIIGSVGTKKQKAEVALDMRLVNVNTAKVVASKRSSASTENSSFSVGLLGGGPVGGTIGGFGGSLSSLKGTNLEAVTKDAIAQSVHFLVGAAKQSKGIAVAPTTVPAPAPAQETTSFNTAK